LVKKNIPIKDIKKNIPDIIDSIDDDSFLEAVYDILQSKQNQGDGKIWQSLTDRQQEEVLNASDETQEPNQQTDHDIMIERNRKWLEKSSGNRTI